MKLEDVAFALERLALLIEKDEEPVVYQKGSDYYLLYRGRIWRMKENGESTPASETEVPTKRVALKMNELPPKMIPAVRKLVVDLNRRDTRETVYPMDFDGPGTAHGPWGAASVHDQTPQGYLDFSITT